MLKTSKEVFARILRKSGLPSATVASHVAVSHRL
jgi:hypothetical protein